MIGIPKTLNTKRDVENLQEMAKTNLIDRKEWVERLKNMQKEDIFNLPVLEKGDGYFTIPKTERELPEKYASKAIAIIDEENRQNEVYKIEGEIEEDYIPLSAGYQQAERLGITQDEIKKMIEELI